MNFFQNYTFDSQMGIKYYTYILLIIMEHNVTHGNWQKFKLYFSCYYHWNSRIRTKFEDSKFYECTLHFVHVYLHCIEQEIEFTYSLSPTFEPRTSLERLSKHHKTIKHKEIHTFTLGQWNLLLFPSSCTNGIIV